MRARVVLFSCVVLTAAGLQQYAAFDAASASSTYSAGNLAGSPAFAAQQALSGGSGYWWGMRQPDQPQRCFGAAAFLFLAAGAPVAATPQARAQT